jgi:hypothetical protein
MSANPFSWIFKPIDSIIKIAIEVWKRDREQRDRVAKYFDDLAVCLNDMAASFKAHEIPHEPGHQLNTTIANFKRVAYSTYSKKSEKDRKEVRKMFRQLRTIARQATHLDTLMLAEQSKYSTQCRTEAKALSKELKRAAGDFKGAASSLRGSDL